MRYYSSGVMQNILNNERFVNYVDVTLIDGTVINLEPSDLLEGCSISDRIDCLINLIGNTIGKSCTILISNHNGSYTDTDFLGASMKVYTATHIVGVVPFLFKSELGEFSITSVNVDDDTITLTGVDNMIKLDVPYVPTVTLPCTIVDIYEDICAQCGFMSISLGSMGELGISNMPSNCTCRIMIIWICEVLGANAKVSEGYLNISQFFSLPTGVDVKPYSATIAHTSTIVSGIEITNTSGIITTYGSEGFLVRIKNNPLVNEHEQEVGQFLYSILKDFEFVSFSGEFPPDPRFESLDVINVTDKDGILHQTILTGVIYDVSDKMTLECNVSDEPTNNATYEDVETRTSEFETQSKIEKSSSEILLQVSSTYTPKSNAIQTDTLHYLATSASSGVTTSTAGWTTTPQSVTSVNKYLWTYHTYTYADSTQASPHTADTTPVITGVYGDRGQQGESGTYVWNLLPAVDDKRIKWMVKHRIKSYSYDYSNGTYTLVTDAPNPNIFQQVYTDFIPMDADMLALRGKQFSYHADSISSSYTDANPRVYLNVSTNGSDITASYFLDREHLTRTYTMPDDVLYYRFWLRADQTRNNSPEDTVVDVKGVKIEVGDVATPWTPHPSDLLALDVLEIKPLYYLNTTSTAPSAPTSEVTSTSTSAETWTTVMPTLTATARYVFTCDQTKYTGNNFAWSAPVLNQYLTDLDSRMTTAESKITDSAIVNTVATNMKVGGRNLLLNTETRQLLENPSSGSLKPTINYTMNQTVTEWGAADAIRAYGSLADGATASTFATMRNASGKPNRDAVVGTHYVHSIYLKNNHSTNQLNITVNGLTAVGRNIHIYNPDSGETDIIDNTSNTYVLPAGKIVKFVAMSIGSLTAQQAIRGLQFSFGAKNTSTKEFDFTYWHPQIEEGDTATDWQPAPSDNAKQTVVEQLDDKISLVVDGSSTSSQLVLTQDTLDAVANDINLNGRVTFSGLSSTAKSAIADNTLSNIYTEGTTTIDGGKITAYSVTAREIDVEDVFAQNVTATGTITGVTIKGASGEFTEKFFTDIVLQDTVGNEINGKMYFDPSNKLFKVLIASPEYGDDPQAPFYGTMEFSNQNMSIGHAHNVSIFSRDGEISLNAPIGGISLSPSVSCNEFHANNQFSVSSGGKFIINNANGSGNSKILTSTSSGMAFKSLYDLAVTEGNGTFTDKTISSGTWTKIGKFTIPKGKYLIITQADISTGSGGTYTNGVVGLGINTGTSTKSSYARFDSKVNCNAGSVYLQNVRVVSSSSSTDINVWVNSTMANAISVNAGFMYLGLPG